MSAAEQNAERPTAAYATPSASVLDWLTMRDPIEMEWAGRQFAGERWSWLLLWFNDHPELLAGLQASAELLALKARRCDGCAHWHGAGDTPDHGWCLPLDGFVGAPDFSCAAWTEKP